jgi:mono/diheme cytochrome c family protein
MRKWIAVSGLVVLAAMVAIQLVPYGRDHANPPITGEPQWDTPRTRALAVRACFDCHSNETVWPWYSHVAPVSWLVQRDVEEGRRALNYSEWNRGQREAHESARSVRTGEMPPWYYALPVTRARLTREERDHLIAGLEASFGVERGRTGRHDR